VERAAKVMAPFWFLLLFHMCGVGCVAVNTRVIKAFRAPIHVMCGGRRRPPVLPEIYLKLKEIFDVCFTYEQYKIFYYSAT